MEPLKDILAEKRAELDLDMDTVVERTGIPARYISHLENGEYYKLPPDAYVYGYLRKLSHVYGLHVDELWETYKHEKGELVRSGKTDHFPGLKNVEEGRRPVTGKPLLYFVLVSLATAVAAYIGWQVIVLLQPPRVEVIAPTEDITTSVSEYTLQGMTDKRNRITLNGEPLLLDEQGAFSRTVTLQEGVNVFEFRAEKLLGAETRVSRRIVYEPLPEVPAEMPVPPIDGMATPGENTNITTTPTPIGR